MLDDLPPFLYDDPDVRAVIHCYARFADEADARAEEVRRQFFLDQADVLLGAWEASLGITVAPIGKTVAERRDLALTYLLSLAESSTGAEWEARLLDAVGSGYTYREHDADDPGSGPAYTVTISLLVPASSETFRRAERLLRRMTPAHLDLIITSDTSGFQLDNSQLDQEPFGA